MTTVKMDVRVFGHNNANEIYGLLIVSPIHLHCNLSYSLKFDVL